MTSVSDPYSLMPDPDPDFLTHFSNKKNNKNKYHILTFFLTKYHQFLKPSFKNSYLLQV